MCSHFHFLRQCTEHRAHCAIEIWRSFINNNEVLWWIFWVLGKSLYFAAWLPACGKRYTEKHTHFCVESLSPHQVSVERNSRNGKKTFTSATCVLPPQISIPLRMGRANIWKMTTWPLNPVFVFSIPSFFGCSLTPLSDVLVSIVQLISWRYT